VLNACGVSGAGYHDKWQNSRCGLPGMSGHPLELNEYSTGQYQMADKFFPVFPNIPSHRT
jgi:hypothetical protein